MTDLNLSVLISAVDKFSAPAKKVANISDAMSKSLHDGEKKLQALGKENKSIKTLEALQQKLGKTASAMDMTRQTTARLGRELASTIKPSKQLQKQFEVSKSKLASLKVKHGEQRESLRKLRGELRGAGIDTRRLRHEQERIKTSIDKTTVSMKKLGDLEARQHSTRERYNRALQRAANTALLAGGLHRVGRGALSFFTNPVQEMRQVERSKGDLSSLGMSNLDPVVNAGRKMAQTVAGITTSSFIAAAYDIRSGISTLSDEGVADMTELSAMTAKATKSSIAEMTSLFATSYGTFKHTLFKGISDKEFGGALSALLSKSVEKFKTDGGKMQQAIESMGEGLTKAGISVSEQFSALGMLQQKMQAGASGTVLAALERSAAKAQERFTDLGYSISTLDQNGNMRSLPELLEEMQVAFGQEYTTEVGSQIQKAFGSDEAVKFFKALWGQQETFRKNIKALEGAQKQGVAFTDAMAKAADSNWDSRLQILSQRWGVIKEKIGRALIPALELLTPALEWVANLFSRFSEKNSTLVASLAITVAGIGGLALMLAPVITSVTALGVAIAYLRRQSASTSAAIAASSASGGVLGGAAGKGKGLLSKMGGKLGTIGTVLSAVTIGSTLMGPGSAGEKAKAVTEDASGIAGAVGGAKLGAMLGTFILPGIGTAIGALAGSVIGGMGGSWIGEKITGLFSDDNEEGEIVKQINTAASQPALAAVGGRVMTDNSNTSISVQQQPGESGLALAKRVMEELKEEKRLRQSGGMYDHG